MEFTLSLWDVLIIVFYAILIGFNIGWWLSDRIHKKTDDYNNKLIDEYRQAVYLQDQLINEYKAQGRIRVIKVKLEPVIDTNLESRMN